jgi:hypothetical protein
MRTTLLATVAGLTTATALIASPTAAFAKASVDGLEGFDTVVPTAFVDDNPAGVELMFAECDMQRVEKPDGSAVEHYQCQLTDPFVEFPGTPPERALVDRAGQCIWYSDYLLDKTGEFLYAETSRLTVTPSGKVSVTAIYPPNPLSAAECEDAGTPAP